MALKIITADQRLAAPSKINIALFGPSGVGKTTQARTLPPETTLFVDLEAGTLAIQDWPGDVIDVRATAAEHNMHPWDVARAIACVLGGPDPTDSNGPYSKAAYDWYVATLFDGNADVFAKYSNVFFDSITVASRFAFEWSKLQPQAFNDKGKPDTRGAYGLLGQEMVRWLTVCQHIPGKSIIVVGILNKEVDDLKRVSYTPQIEGGKTARELPGIFDQVLTLQNFVTADGQPYRAFVCNQDNREGFPAKDRSGRLENLEPPDLGALIHKIRTGPRRDGTLQRTMPAAPAPTPTAPAAAEAPTTTAQEG
jgi:hypothetical protein